MKDLLRRFYDSSAFILVTWVIVLIYSMLLWVGAFKICCKVMRVVL